MSSTTCTTTTSPAGTSHAGRPLAKGFGELLISVFAGLGQRLLLWQSRASDRAHLQELPDYMLKDMGLTRTDATQESAKPFWRP